LYFVVFEIVHFPPTISIPALFHGVSNCLLDITRASWMEVSPYAGDSLFAKARGYRRRWLLIALERSNDEISHPRNATPHAATSTSLTQSLG
jgi:hypothetical protein